MSLTDRELQVSFVVRTIVTCSSNWVTCSNAVVVSRSSNNILNWETTHIHFNFQSLLLFVLPLCLDNFHDLPILTIAAEAGRWESEHFSFTATLHFPVPGGEKQKTIHVLNISQKKLVMLWWNIQVCSIKGIWNVHFLLLSNILLVKYSSTKRSSKATKSLRFSNSWVTFKIISWFYDCIVSSRTLFVEYIQI